jgi:diaminohydroxyphosphoribosylaminopyrimidine deaminase/5-amino-6-(5-phosphoribosylamino)uracil reductase
VSADDTRWMALALSLGRRGHGSVWPNPAVGCVLVTDGRVVGRGFTGPGGRPHAEVVALERAGASARGSTAYVSLEPCAHHGKTPPCAEALVTAGVRRVVTALEDPDPRVSSRGHAILRRAGIEVTTGVLADRARREHLGFLHRVVHGRPMVTLKLATSFDGRIATASGESKWITGEAARRWVHGERCRHDAILVGGGTARADDPALTVRGLGIVRQPVRIVASRELQLPEMGRLAGGEGAGPLWLLHGRVDPERKARWQSRARLIEVREREGQLDTVEMIEALGRAGLTRVFCEGGGILAASLLAANMVDRLVGVTAGIALGADGRAAIARLPSSTLATAPRFRLAEAQQVGADVLHTWERD